jgi:site-specific recombinase
VFDVVLVGTAQVGWKPLDALTLDLHLPYNITLADYAENNVSGAGNTDYVGLGLGASWWFTSAFGVNLGFDAVVFAQANAATPSITAGVEWRPRLW